MYQKAFVELFMTESELDVFISRAEIEEKERRAKGEGEEGVIKWFAGNRKGESRSNMRTGDVNAVTWGVFGGKEIVTTTMIEEMSFKAWKVRPSFLCFFCSHLPPVHRANESQEEAFAIWLEWSHLYPNNSPSKKLIQHIADTRWLVSVVHHNYKDESGLWTFLLAQPASKE